MPNKTKVGDDQDLDENKKVASSDDDDEDVPLDATKPIDIEEPDDALPPEDDDLGLPDSHIRLSRSDEAEEDDGSYDDLSGDD